MRAVLYRTLCCAQGFLKALLRTCNAAEGAPGVDKQARDGVGAGANARRTAPDQAALASARVAVRCLALLLTSLPHFNYAADILQARPTQRAPYLPHQNTSSAQAWFLQSCAEQPIAKCKY